MTFSRTAYRNQNVMSAPLIVLVMILLAYALIPATAADGADSLFQPAMSAGGHALALRGSGRLRWKGLIPVYDLGLYLPQDLPSTDVFSDVPKRLEFHYFVSIAATDFGDAAAPYLEKNVPPRERAKLQGRIDSINKLYRDVKKADRYTLTYVPGKGTELAWNDTVLGVIEGADFAAAYFRIWLGEQPISLDMKQSLLKGH